MQAFLTFACCQMFDDLNKQKPFAFITVPKLLDYINRNSVRPKAAASARYNLYFVNVDVITSTA